MLAQYLCWCSGWSLLSFDGDPDRCPFVHTSGRLGGVTIEVDQSSVFSRAGEVRRLFWLILVCLRIFICPHSQYRLLDFVQSRNIYRYDLWDCCRRVLRALNFDSYSLLFRLSSYFYTCTIFPIDILLTMFMIRSFYCSSFLIRLLTVLFCRCLKYCVFLCTFVMEFSTRGFRLSQC